MDRQHHQEWSFYTDGKQQKACIHAASRPWCDYSTNAPKVLPTMCILQATDCSSSVFHLPTMIFLNLKAKALVLDFGCNLGLPWHLSVNCHKGIKLLWSCNAVLIQGLWNTCKSSIWKEIHSQLYHQWMLVIYCRRSVASKLTCSSQGLPSLEYLNLSRNQICSEGNGNTANPPIDARISLISMGHLPLVQNVLLVTWIRCLYVQREISPYPD